MASSAITGPLAGLPRVASAAPRTMSVSIRLFSIPDAPTAAKKGQAAKKPLKHQAAAGDAERRSSVPMITSVAPSPSVVQIRDHGSGSLRSR